jgi:hypothetical protein
VRSGYIGGERYTFFWTAASFRDLDEEIQHILASLGATRRSVEEQGGTYGVVLIPEKIRVLGPLCQWPDGSELADYRQHTGPLLGQVVQWAAREGVQVLDLTPALERSAQSGRIPWFATDTHWNALGNAVAAEEVARWISTMRGGVPPPVGNR